MNSACPFCALPRDRVVWESEHVVAIRDLYPVSDGHTLLITRRHCATYFEALPQERESIWQAVNEIKTAIDASHAPQGYNVGFNVGEVSGQTVMHLHVHLIPRYDGDMDDPRGGVRGVIPGRQKYAPSTGERPPPEDVALATDSDPFRALPAFIGGEEQHFGRVLQRALGTASLADIVTAFIQPQGLAQIVGDLRDALERGATVRLLTGDYLNATSPDALRQLLGLQSEHPERFRPFFYVGGGSLSFHAKAYIFMRDPHGVAYVGSSNLTKTALTSGLEWNLRAVTSASPSEFEAIRARFDRVLHSPYVKPLTRDLVDAYALRAKVPGRTEDTTEGPEPRVPPPPAHEIQLDALAALRNLRTEGAQAGLVVMATGLGKTYLGALDCRQIGASRALFIAHREEILTQARDSWARVFPDKVLGVLLGDQKEPDADILFASVQTLARKQNLLQFPADHFDYIVVDEFHHASAGTYRRILGHFTPKFMLGLTATPDRMDGASILELCHDNLAFRCGLVHGINKKLLVPFHYFGVKDEVDFTAIPWRGRWPAEELTQAVATQGRAEQTLREYAKHAPAGRRRTLAFCCSVAHADFTADFFRSRGVPAVAVHSGPSSAPREESLRKLRAGELEVLCAVDVFNEGLDVPDINVVLMLRPTESPVIFLQQLGRGLRRPEQSDKTHLTVVDFIGNHRSFMVKPQALVALTGLDLTPGAALERIRKDELELPEGCSVEIETTAIDMLQKVSRLSRDDMLIHEYTSLRDSHGRRPTAHETLATGIHMQPVHDRYGTWFDFVDGQGDLTVEEHRVLERHRAWFQDLSKTKLTKSYKMVTLKALLERDTLRGGDAVTEIVRHCERILRDDLLLRAEAKVDLEDAALTSLEATWRAMPLAVWAAGKSTSRKWFTLSGDMFRFLGTVEPGDTEVFDQMTAELVELRLAQHRNTLRGRTQEGLAPIRLRVSHASGRPILRLDRDHRPDTPEANTDPIVVVNDEPYLFGFRKVAINQAVKELGGPNQLPALMRSWFGPQAGMPGSQHFVQLSRQGEHWVLSREPSGAMDALTNVVPFPTLPYFADLKVACGQWEHQGEVHQAVSVAVASKLALDPKRHFVVQASGDSMDGGSTPIADGSLVLCEWLSGQSTDAIEGKACLLTGSEDATTSFAVLKVPVRREGQWYLHSWNAAYPDQALESGVSLRPVARFLEVVEEAAVPTLWGRYDRDSAVALFGLKADRSWEVGHRDIEVNGRAHSVLFVNLTKGPDVKANHRYADRFVSTTEFQWESQPDTTPGNKKGRNILDHDDAGRLVHLFCRYAAKVKSKTQPFVYCGTLHYLRHEGSAPMRVWFHLDQPLPENLWRLWSA